MYYYKYETSVGDLYIESDDQRLLSIGISKPQENQLFESEIIKETHKQLEEYFKQERKVFDLPFELTGSDFEIKVYEEMMAVPYGETISYKGLAEHALSPKAYRAVGSVCAKNPLPIVVPCHRILKVDQALGGYGLGLSMKVQLLELEGKKVENGYVR